VEQIGRYRIQDELGRGATGVVYRAQDPAIGRVIAIKTIRLLDFTDDTERDRLRERLFREAQSAGILSHPNIVTIYDIAEENGLAYIFMEFVDGPPLEKILNGGEALDKDALLGIFRQTGIALDYAHKKGIVHRDIKPANILIHDGTLAKITDFGVAKILSQQMTQSGVMMGTPNYMSPEQVQGHGVDGRADQFSLAVIAYETLTGEKPFVADHLPSLLYRIVREDPVPPQRLNPTLSPQVEVVLRKALAKNASERYPYCCDFVEALAAACNLNPGWRPLPRSSAQSMPTIGAGAAIDHTSVPQPPPAAAPGPVVQPASLSMRPTAHHEETESRTPLIKTLVWMLVGIGLVGLVLFGAQKFLFNRNADSAAAPTEARDQKPADATPSAAVPDKPPAVAKPSPLSGSSASNDPETKPKPPATDAPRHETPPAIPAPVVVAKSSGEHTVQVLSDPPGAQIDVDGSSELTCKAPCMLSLTSGRHTLNAHLTGYRSYPRVFNIPQDSDIFLQLSKAGGTLSVTSTPQGASIEINNEMQPKKTPALFNLAPGTYHVRVARNGASLEFEAEVRDGAFVGKNVSF
jgi:serine/threonine-protein kinase